MSEHIALWFAVIALGVMVDVLGEVFEFKLARHIGMLLKVIGLAGGVLSAGSLT